MTIARRSFLRRLSAALTVPLATRAAWAQAPTAAGASLPLRSTGLEHLGLTVPDPGKSVRFYGLLFNPKIFKEKDPPPRFYVTLGVGYIAIGGSPSATPQIDHFCTLVENYRPQEMRGELEAAGIPPGRFGMLPDPDGLRLQLLGTPGGLASTTVPADPVSDQTPLLQPLGLDSVVLLASDVNRLVAHYRKLFGPETPRGANRDQPTSAAFTIARTRLAIEQAPAGTAARVDRFAVRVERFDRRLVSEAVARFGGTPVATAEDVVRFRDPDGILFELKPSA